jgi:hypothetical protein
VAGVHERVVRRVEQGKAIDLTIRYVRSVLEAAGARLYLNAWWNGAALDRLLDERHAALVERVVRTLRAFGWRTAVEVSFNVFGDRGSIDVLAGHDVTRSVLVIEVKASIGSIEETNRTFDKKVRHAADLASERFGWRPSAVSRVLAVPEESTVRRIVERHAATFDSAYPKRSREVRRWLRNPMGSIRGLWFVSEVRGRARRHEQE